MHGISVEQMRRELSRESLEMPLSGMNHGAQKNLLGVSGQEREDIDVPSGHFKSIFDRGEVIKSSIKMNLFSIV